MGRTESEARFWPWNLKRSKAARDLKDLEDLPRERGRKSSIIYGTHKVLSIYETGSHTQPRAPCQRERG